MSETTNHPTSSSLPLPGLETVAPGVAYQVQAAHDAQVNALRALLAEARREGDRQAELYALAVVESVALRDDLIAAHPVLDAARALVASGEAQLPTVGPGAAELVAAVRAFDGRARRG